MMAEEEEVRIEVDAVQAVYGDDCHVIQPFPPHLSVHISPRTAEDSSQQFVEATIGIKTSLQYPNEPPDIYVIETKGLDVNRKTYLINQMKLKAEELSSCLMIVSLCEEAVEILSNMNHPEGDCPLCLYPLFPQNEDDLSKSSSFMKLMSCYHCFHSECIIRWWKWLHEQSNSEGSERIQRGAQVSVNEANKANCPVCRKEFDKKDIEHVLNYIGTNHAEPVGGETNVHSDGEKELLESESEANRRKKFEELLKLQEGKNGLIEPKKDLVILPGMYISLPTNITNNTEEDQDNEDGAPNSNSGANEIMPAQHHKQKNRRRHRKPGLKKENVRRQQWVQKGNSSEQ
ncbi:hypothetical protein LUZ60_014373 [Juncus effusus]|nr:hypothetical protein LUZ60_014373 [Juncus effusus]